MNIINIMNTISSILYYTRNHRQSGEVKVKESETNNINSITTTILLF